MADVQYNAPKLEKDITVPDLFVHVAQLNPNRDLVQIVYDYPDDDTKPVTSQRFTWSQVIEHAQNAAVDLRRRLSPAGEDVKPRKPGDPLVVVGILAAHGYEYYVNLLACTMNRWTVLLISPKNSLEAIEHILRVSNASLLLVDDMGHSMRAKMPELPGISTIAFSLPEIYRSPNARAPPLAQLSQEDLEKELDLPQFILHTSGSTGHPKTIPWTHRFVLGGVRYSFKGSSGLHGRHMYCIPPLSHAMGMFSFILFALANGNIMLCPMSSPPRPPSARVLLKYAPFIKGGLVGLPPSIIEELYEMSVAWRRKKEEASGTIANDSHEEDPLQIIKDNLWMLLFAGAPLRKDIGDELTKSGVPITTGFGSTEILPVGKAYPQPNLSEDWSYFEFREGYNLHFLPLEGDDETSRLRELVIGPGECTPAVINHENPVGYATSDVFERHPKIEYLWRHHSRKGDVTVLSNGEKTDNRQIENLLLVDPNIQHVLVFGAGRPLNGVLVAPSPAFKGDVSTFLDVISATITNTNNVIPAHSRLLHELIIIQRPDKPFALTDKGTLKKGLVLEMYKDDIDAAYENFEKGNANGGWHFDGDLAKVEDIKAYVREVVLNVLGKAVPSDSADLFLCGLDSLLASRLRSAIVSLLNYTEKGATEDLPRNIVYSYPSIDMLTSFIVGVISGKEGTAASSIQERIQDSIKKFSQGFKRHTPSGRSVETGGMVIALTGSTGSLGCFLLHFLLQREDVKHIYLLNRPGNVGQRERLAAGFEERGLDLSVLKKKEAEGLITYLDIDFSKGDLGLAKKDYEQLRETLTHIIHSAWQLNFNLILESYEQVHIAGVRNLIDLALASPLPNPPRFVFISSIASAINYRVSEKRPIPEEAVDDPSIPADQGYGQSKYVSERILVKAVQEAGLKATIIRVGQLCGDTKAGVWNKSEHVPILFRSSVEINMIPEDIPAVRWLPSDIAASAILQQTVHSTKPLEYFNVENPAPTPWLSVAKAVAASSPKPLQFVKFNRWLSEVGSDKWAPEQVPARLLVDYFQVVGAAESAENAAFLALDRSAAVAPELIEIGEINDTFVKKFLAYQLK